MRAPFCLMPMFKTAFVVGLFGVARAKVATVHDLGGNYDRFYAGGMSFCGEEVRLTANYPDLVQVEFKDHPMKCAPRLSSPRRCPMRLTRIRTITELLWNPVKMYNYLVTPQNAPSL